MRLGRTYLIGAAFLWAQSASAAPLDPAACAELKTERQTLIAAGVKSDMDRGPEWAKANLAPDRLGKIERLISVEEQLSFRCGEFVTARPAIKEQPKPDAAAGNKDGKPGAQTAAPADTALNAIGLDPAAAPKKKKKSTNKSKSKDTKAASGSE